MMSRPLATLSVRHDRSSTTTDPAVCLLSKQRQPFGRRQTLATHRTGAPVIDLDAMRPWRLRLLGAPHAVATGTRMGAARLRHVRSREASGSRLRFRRCCDLRRLS